ncbi:MAG: TetR/AcrR family transcriptional regulator, partial [Acidimicrobiales bacterium]
KQPRQQRAVETRERILDSAARIFAAHGYAAGTTNRIAEDADLSVGSLYQYFPNKDAILAELVRRHVADGLAALAPLLAEPPRGDLTARLDQLVSALIDLHVHDPRLHQVLFEEAPRPPDVLAELHATEEQIVAIVAAWLEADPSVVHPDPLVAARLTVAAVESLVHRLVARPEPVTGAAVLRREIVHLLHAYLRTPVPCTG